MAGEERRRWRPTFWRGADDDELGGRAFFFVLAAALGATSLTVLVFWSWTGPHLDPRYAAIGEFLSYAVGLAVTAASVWITFNISRAANRISKRLGDSDVLDFVDKRLAESVSGVRAVAQAIEKTRAAASGINETLNIVGNKFLKLEQSEIQARIARELEKRKNEAKARDPDNAEAEVEFDYEALRAVTTEVMLDLATPEVRKLRLDLLALHTSLMGALDDVERTPLTMALLGNAFKTKTKFADKVAGLIANNLRKGAGDARIDFTNVADLREALNNAFMAQGVFHDDDASLYKLAQNLSEISAWLTIMESTKEIQLLALLGALIDLQPVFQPEPDPAVTAPAWDNRTGLMCNRGLVILGSIYEIMPDLAAYETFFATIYKDPHSADLAKKYLTTCGFAQNMYWTADCQKDWDAMTRAPESALHIMYEDQTKLPPLKLVPIGAGQAMALAPRKALWPWSAKARQPVGTAFERDRSLALRIDARLRRGESVESACRTYGVKVAQFAEARRTLGPVGWIGPIGNLKLENDWARAMGQWRLRRTAAPATPRRLAS